MKRLLVALYVLTCSGPAWGFSLDAVASHLAADLSSRVRPEYTTIDNFPLFCAAYAKRDIQSTKYHAFACVGVTVGGDGVVLGGVQNKRGDLICQLNGYYTAGCLTLSGCGLSSRTC